MKNQISGKPLKLSTNVKAEKLSLHWMQIYSADVLLFHVIYLLNNLSPVFFSNLSIFLLFFDFPSSKSQSNTLCDRLILKPLLTSTPEWITSPLDQSVQSIFSKSLLTVSTHQNESLFELINTTWTSHTHPATAASVLRIHTVRRIGLLFVLMINVYRSLVLAHQCHDNRKVLYIANQEIICDSYNGICYSSVNRYCSMFFWRFALNRT